MGLFINLIRVIKAILTQDDRGCTFFEILQITAAQDRNLTPEDMDEADVLEAIKAGKKEGLLVERGDRILVVKSGTDHTQKSSHADDKTIQEEVVKDICMLKIKRDVTNPYTLKIDLESATAVRGVSKIREWLDNNKAGSFTDGPADKMDAEGMLPQMNSDSYLVDNPESDKMSQVQILGQESSSWIEDIPNNDTMANIRCHFLKDFATLVDKRDDSTKPSRNLGSRLVRKRVTADSKTEEFVTPAKLKKVSHILIADKMSDDGKKDRLRANSCRSTHAPCSRVGQHKDDLATEQSELAKMNVDILHYAQKLFENLSAGLDKMTIENTTGPKNLMDSSEVPLKAPNNTGDDKQGVSLRPHGDGGDPGDVDEFEFYS